MPDKEQKTTPSSGLEIASKGRVNQEKNDILLGNVYAAIGAAEKERDAASSIHSHPPARRYTQQGNYKYIRNVDHIEQNDQPPTLIAKNYQVRALSHIMTYIRFLDVYGKQATEEEVNALIERCNTLFENCTDERQAYFFFKKFVGELTENTYDQLKENKEAIAEIGKETDNEKRKGGDVLNKGKLSSAFNSANVWAGLEIKPYILETNFISPISGKKFTVKTIPLIKREALDKHLFGDDKDESLWKERVWYKSLSEPQKRFCDYYCEKMRTDPNVVLNSGLRAIIPGLKNAYETQILNENGKIIYSMHHAAALPMANEELFKEHRKEAVEYAKISYQQFKENVTGSRYCLYTSLVSRLGDKFRGTVNTLTGKKEELIDGVIYDTANIAANSKDMAHEFGHINLCLNGFRHIETVVADDLAELLKIIEKLKLEKNFTPEQEQAYQFAKEKCRFFNLHKPTGKDRELASYDIAYAYNKLVYKFSELGSIVSCASGENRTLLFVCMNLLYAMCEAEGIDYKDPKQLDNVRAICRTIVNSGHLQQVTSGFGGIVGKGGIRAKSADSIPKSLYSAMEALVMSSADTKRPYSTPTFKVPSWESAFKGLNNPTMPDDIKGVVFLFHEKIAEIIKHGSKNSLPKEIEEAIQRAMDDTADLSTDDKIKTLGYLESSLKHHLKDSKKSTQKRVMKILDQKRSEIFEKDYQQTLSDSSKIQESNSSDTIIESKITQKTQENQSAVELVYSTMLFAKDFAVEHPAFTIAFVGGLLIGASCLTLGIGLAVGAPFAIAAVTAITGAGSTAVSSIASAATTHVAIHGVAATTTRATITAAGAAHAGLAIYSLFADNGSSNPKTDSLLHTATNLSDTDYNAAADDDTEFDADPDFNPNEDPDGPNFN